MSPDRRSRPPEPLELPEDLAVPPAPPGARPPARAELPYFITLQQQAEQHQQALEGRRTNDRHERIRAIQATRDSKVVTYYSLETLHPSHTVLLYELLQKVGRQKRIDLFLRSPGGSIDAAFKMAGYLRHFAEEHFAVIIPHDAKSAATLLALGSNELVMGESSELGPIDPRIKVQDNYGRTIQVSATAVKDALALIEELAGESAERSLKYIPLIESINLDVLGEYTRALKSSKQHAEYLLKTGKLLNDEDNGRAADLARDLAEGYYSHGYPIGPKTAKEDLGLNVTFAPREQEHAQLWDTIWQLHNLYDVAVASEQGPYTVLETEEFSIRPSPVGE